MGFHPSSPRKRKSQIPPRSSAIREALFCGYSVFMILLLRFLRQLHSSGSLPQSFISASTRK